MADQPNDSQEANVPTEAPAPSNFSDLLSSVKNEEGKQKYADIPTAIEGLKNAQDYIPQLKQQLEERDSKLAQLEAELNARSSVEEQVSKLLNQEPAQPQETPNVAPQQPEAPLGSGLSEEQAKALFSQMLSEKSQVDTATSNRQLVNEKLVGQYGNQTAHVVKSKLETLGVTPEQFEKLSAETPQVVLSMFATDPSKPSTPKPSSINTSAFSQPEASLEKPPKSLMRGSSTKEQIEYLRKVREDVYKRFDVQSN